MILKKENRIYMEYSEESRRLPGGDGGSLNKLTNLITYAYQKGLDFGGLEQAHIEVEDLYFDWATDYMNLLSSIFDMDEVTEEDEETLMEMTRSMFNTKAMLIVPDDPPLIKYSARDLLTIYNSRKIL